MVAGEIAWSVNEKRTFTFINSRAFRYYKILITDIVDGINYLRLSEIELIEAEVDTYSITGGYIDATVGDEGIVATLKGGDGASNVSTTDSVPTMTSNTAPSGVVTWSSSSETLYDGWKAFDDDFGTHWADNTTSLPSSLTYQFPEDKVINKYTLRLDSGLMGRALKDWTLRGSNDDFIADDNVLDTVINETAWTTGETKTFEFNNSTAYESYRIVVTAGNGETSIQLTEMELIEAQDQPAVFTSATIAKADAEGDWNGTQDGAYLTSSLPNVLSSADATNVILNGEVLATDEVYLGDGTDFVTHTCVGASYLDPSDTTGRTAKYLLDGDVTDELGVYDGTATNVTYADGVFGQSGVFNGSSSSVDTGLVHPSVNFTVSLWFKSTDTVAGLISNSNASGGSNNDGLAVKTNDVVIYQNDVILGTHTYTATLTDGNWHHVSVTNDGTTLTVFVDGVSDGTLSSTGLTQASIYTWVLGYLRRSPVTTWLNGSIDHVEIFNSVLTASEVQDLYNTGKTKLPHNQTFTPTFACSKDNTEFEVTFDGTNYNALTKSSATAEAELVAPNTPLDEFETVLWTGNNTAGRKIPTSFQPNFGWTKLRDSYGQSHVLFSDLMGLAYLNTDTTDAQSTTDNPLTSWDVDGITISDSGLVNYNNGGFVGWFASLPNHTASNTDGTITSETKANSFMSVVSFTSSGGTETIGHGLGKTPELIIAKNRDASSNWEVYNATIGHLKTLKLNLIDAEVTSGAWGNTSPSASVFSLLTWASTDKSIAYCFTSVEGKCKVGSYTGTGATGNAVDCGFEPAWVMIKRTSLADSWYIYDDKREGVDGILWADLSGAEAAANHVNFTATGFELATTTSNNASGHTHIYLAIAKNTPEDLLIKELHSASGVVANTGAQLGFKVKHKEVDTKTSAIYSALMEG